MHMGNQRLLIPCCMHHRRAVAPIAAWCHYTPPCWFSQQMHWLPPAALSEYTAQTACSAAASAYTVPTASSSSGIRYSQKSSSRYHDAHCRNLRCEVSWGPKQPCQTARTPPWGLKMCVPLTWPA